MGLMDDFNVDMDEIKAGGFDIEDGTYDFEISEALKQEGTKNKPDTTFFIIKYDLDEDGTYWEWFTVAEDGELTKRAKQSLGFLKTRLKSLGFSDNLNELEAEELEGVVGTLTLKTTKTAKGEFQNIRRITVGDAEEAEDDEPEEEPVVDDKKLKQQVAAKRAAREAKTPPAKTTTRRSTSKKGDDEDSDNPFA